jgi:hypothetical protein
MQSYLEPLFIKIMWDTIKKTAEWINIIARIEKLESEILELKKQNESLKTQGNKCPKCCSNTVFLDPEVYGSFDPEKILSGELPKRYWICSNKACNHKLPQLINLNTMKFDSDDDFFGL